MKLADEPKTGVVARIPNEARAEAAHSRSAYPEGSVEQALEQLLFERRAPDLVFQPIVDLQRSMTVGYEVLSRFRGPPNMTPDRWFAGANKLGRGVELEALVIESALARRSQLPDNTFLSINVAPEALLDEQVRKLLRAGSLARLVFELTEHSVVTDYDLLKRAIAEVRNLGAFVAVDDAGAGYASLQHILALRPDFVKLDRTLIAGLHVDEAKAALVEMFGGFTSRTDAWLLAEGIEERDELSRLIQLKVPLGQGYFLGRPDREMRRLDPQLCSLMQSFARDESKPLTILALVELQPSFYAADADDTLLALLSTRNASGLLPLLDDSHRPVALAGRSSSGELTRRHALSVLENSPADEALKRALTRPESTRFDPLMCCDESGQYRGMVRIERLVEALLQLTRSR